MSDERNEAEPSGASGGSLAKPSGVAAACAAAADIGYAMQAVEGFPTKQLQWEMVGKDTDGTPIYRNNWGEYRRWIPVTERLPELHEHVIGWQQGWARTAEVWRGSKGEWLGGDFEPAGNVTHWMPLPAPPTDAK